MPQEITAIDLRHHLGQVLDDVANKRTRFLIKRAGIPAAVILNVRDYEDLEDLLDTAHEQQDPTFQKSLRDARAGIDAGKTVSLEDLRHDLAKKERKRVK